ncbi:MAG TPA: UDP-N-acetylmuramate dehydrogenase [Actinomycetota bacterium]|nr:UDP-N-acetylmuramate dehydrogenase [Actinomycetota bacterium]
MTIDVAAAILERRAHGKVTRGGSIAGLTSYRLGGPAGVLFEPADRADLDALAEAVAASGQEILIVGRGSNMLVSDRGFPGIAVRLGAGFRWSRVNGATVEAGAAMPLPALATLAMHNRLRGLEFTVAIPASLGGAVRMNAGAHGHEMAEVLETVTLFSLDDASELIVRAEEAGFAYRASALPPGIVIAAAMRLEVGEHDAIVEAMNEAKEWRRTTQPVNLPNGGSVFKNPPGDYAARLIDEVCGKGMAVGGARISEVHANFIVADDSARADDVYSLMQRIRRAVRDATGIELEPELKLIGAFEEASP